jgi:hypothetical protein
MQFSAAGIVDAAQGHFDLSADISPIRALALEAWTRSMGVAARSAKCLRGRPPGFGGESPS